jgi:hypothetical protein
LSVIGGPDEGTESDGDGASMLSVLCSSGWMLPSMRALKALELGTG